MKPEEIFKGTNFEEIQKDFSNNQIGKNPLGFFKKTTKKQKKDPSPVNRDEEL